MKIGCDICNTIANVIGDISKHFSIPINELNEKYDYHKHFGIPINFFKTEEGLNVFDNCLPFDGAAALLQNLSKDNQIYYITSRPVEAIHITMSWLKKHGFPSGPILFYDDKLIITRALGIDLMIEDAPHIIKMLVENGQTVIIKSYGYNSKYKKVAPSFPKWNDFARNLITHNSVEGIKCERLMTKA